MNIDSRARFLVSVAAICALSESAGANPDDPVEFPMVTVTGVAPWGWDITYDSAIVAEPNAFQVPQRPWRRRMASEEYQQFRAEVAAATRNPYRTTDMRCSKGASDTTRQTTSLSGADERFVGAQQLFASINLHEGFSGLRAAIAASPPRLSGGKLVATFTVTYMDGGSESWVVAPGVSPSLIISANLPPPPNGDGIPKPCPITMIG